MTRRTSHSNSGNLHFEWMSHTGIIQEQEFLAPIKKKVTYCIMRKPPFSRVRVLFCFHSTIKFLILIGQDTVMKDGAIGNQALFHLPKITVHLFTIYQKMFLYGLQHFLKRHNFFFFFFKLEYHKILPSKYNGIIFYNRASRASDSRRQTHIHIRISYFTHSEMLGNVTTVTAHLLRYCFP